MRSPTGNVVSDRAAWSSPHQQPASGERRRFPFGATFGAGTPQTHQLTEVPASPDARGYGVSPLTGPPPPPTDSSNPAGWGKGPVIMPTSPGGNGVLHSARGLSATHGSPSYCTTSVQPLTDIFGMFGMARSMAGRRPEPHGAGRTAAAASPQPPPPPSWRPRPYSSRAPRRGACAASSASAAVENIGVPREQQLSRVTNTHLSKLESMLRTLPGAVTVRSPRHQGSSPSPSAGSAADRYTIGRRISQGAFAQVYVGHDSRTNGTVCIKAITNTPEFSLEHEITARVTGHPNIVEYLGRCTIGPRDCLVFGLANQGDLLDMFRHNDERKQQGLPVMMTQRACRAYLAQACAAVAHIHAMGIVHFDIKLDNLLVHDGVLNLCDFGLSGFEGTFRSGRPDGTRSYMAPELAVPPPPWHSSLPSRYAVSKSADIWSMGMLIFTMVLDERCWEEATTDDADYALYAQRVQNGEDVACEEPWRRLAPGLQELVLGMLALDPAVRPSISAVAAGIQGLWTTAS